MNMSLVRKIEKAKDYAHQPERVTLTKYEADFHGNNADHTVSYEAGRLNCSCNYFATHKTCSHAMALGMMLGHMMADNPPTPA